MPFSLIAVIYLIFHVVLLGVRELLNKLSVTSPLFLLLGFTSIIILGVPSSHRIRSISQLIIGNDSRAYGLL